MEIEEPEPLLVARAEPAERLNHERRVARRGREARVPLAPDELVHWNDSDHLTSCAAP